MNCKTIYREAKEYLIEFYSHCWKEISRAKMLDIDLETCIKERGFTYKESYKIKEIDDPKKYKFGMLVSDLEDEIIERSQTFNFVRAFGDILIFSEKYLLYQNDDNKEMWAVESDENTISVYFDFADTQVECKFKKSAINMDKKRKNDKGLNELNDLLDSMLGIDQTEYVTFIEVEISRHFGNNFISNFKSILGSNEFNLDNDDIWLMDLIDLHMRKIMLKTLHDIQEHILRNCLQINNLTVEDFENGVELWRSR